MNPTNVTTEPRHFCPKARYLLTKNHNFIPYATARLVVPDHEPDEFVPSLSDYSESDRKIVLDFFSCRHQQVLAIL
jgi:hypothetical protein